MRGWGKRNLAWAPRTTAGCRAAAAAEPGGAAGAAGPKCKPSPCALPLQPQLTLLPTKPFNGDITPLPHLIPPRAPHSFRTRDSKTQAATGEREKKQSCFSSSLVPRPANKTPPSARPRHLRCPARIGTRHIRGLALASGAADSLESAHIVRSSQGDSAPRKRPVLLKKWFCRAPAKHAIATRPPTLSSLDSCL